MQYFYSLLIFCSFTIIVGLSNTYAGDNTPKLAKFGTSKTFSLPIDCKIDEDCWVMNYVDMGPDDGKKTDPACQSRTYDSHKGTDIAILDGKTMQNGVDVIAPMDGIISKIRDGEPDQWSTPEQIEQIKLDRKECGNAVMIDHGEGLQTIYCHMKKGSIVVKPKQKIKTGDKIGEVGLSGFTRLPHIHFGILQDQKIIDPFTGQNNQASCGKKIKSLWNPNINLQYQPFDIHSAGFLDEIPELKKLERDNNQRKKISLNSDAFTFWTILFGMRENDEIIIEVKDPNGKIFVEDKIIQDRNRARQFYYIGKNTKNKKLKEGAYTGLVKVSRKTSKGQDIVKDRIFSVLVSK